jgi:hypothetical protein
MSGNRSENQHAGAIHSPLLIGLEHPECGLGHCSMASSTGWLLPGRVGWAVEFVCPEHGPYSVSGGRYRSVIEQVLRQSQTRADPADDTRRELADVLRAARALVARPGNDFAWSSWEGPDEALRELDRLIQAVEAGPLPERLDLAVLFGPTGRIQEVSLSSGWGTEFLAVSITFDAALQRVYG